MVRWTGLAPWEFEFPFAGSLTSTFRQRDLPGAQQLLSPSSALLLSSPELSDTKVYEPEIRAHLGTASHSGLTRSLTDKGLLLLYYSQAQS